MWKTILQDTVQFEQGKNSYSFFETCSANQGSSINDLSEQEIVKQIIQNKSWCDLFCQENRIPKHSVLYENISRNKFFRANESGDFDLIIIEKSNPEKVSINEFKKVKVTALDSEQDRINRLQSINTLIGQAKNRVKLGFHKVTMTLIIQADLRIREASNVLSKDIARSSADIIYKEMRQAQEINNQIGISYIKFYQPTSKDFNLYNSFSIYVDRYPTEMKQSLRITQNAHRLLSESAR